ncbi:hypothetical protein [Clostridium perfringens]|uniref:hypothetical protein n=1 Tax=Clostridium perfringens TaxID=1502 RepID=UPI0018E48D8B|nr:hypothetical protein [Clostridium perfringens]MBI5995666.1 hypothetical protein [Clostridium perfringens]MBI6001344.1 hypothetical protein [Clostridium perfringens]
MIDLFSLGVSIALGVPTANWITKNFLNKEYREVKRVSKNLNYLCTEKNIYNSAGEKPRINDIKITNYGYYISLDVEGITTYSSLENLNDYIKSLFKAYYVEISSNKGNIVNLDIINKEINEPMYNTINLEPTKLICGYDLKGNPIVVDMLKTPHIGVVGTSLSGKTKCIEGALKNINGADITLVNCFQDDFLGIRAERVCGNNEILEFLNHVAANKTIRNRPYYIVIDEYNTLSNVKGVDKVIQELLSQARHYNVYLIVIMQKGNHEDCKFKQLFNTRIAFRTIEESTLRAFLGVTVGSGALDQREFYLLHSELVKGKTCTI